MSDIAFIQKDLTELFNFRRGIVISQEYIIKHSGIHPVFSSKTEEEGILGYIDTYMFDGEYITWTTDGINAGTSFYRNGKFSCTNVCGVMALKDGINNISLRYINCLLNLKSIAKSSGNKKVMTDNIIQAKIKIQIPIKEDGTYDLEAQQEIAQKYKTLIEKQNKLIEYKNTLNGCLVEADLAGKYTHNEVNITDLFIPDNGSGTYTKTYCQHNKGNFPVYSGNTVGEFSKINSYDFDGEYLTWAKDGLAGLMMCMNEKFSITNHRGILMPTESCKNIDMEYMKYVLEPVFRKNIKGRMGHNGENEYTTLNGTMIKSISTKVSIPIKEDGTYDLEAQQEIAKKYRKIEDIKKGICDKIDQLVKTKISLKS